MSSFSLEISTLESPIGIACTAVHSRTAGTRCRSAQVGRGASAGANPRRLQSKQKASKISFEKKLKTHRPSLLAAFPKARLMHDISGCIPVCNKRATADSSAPDTAFSIACSPSCTPRDPPDQVQSAPPPRSPARKPHRDWPSGPRPHRPAAPHPNAPPSSAVSISTACP